MLDLIYFRSTSTSDDVRFADFRVFLQKYQQILQENLYRLNYKGKIPTLFQLYKNYNEKMFFGESKSCSRFGTVQNSYR